MRNVSFNRVEVEYRTTGSQSGKMLAMARNEQGQGWQVPIRDMSPNDLRKLADLMEEHGIEPDEFGGSKLCM